MLNYNSTDKFQAGFKKLLKRYKTLEEDFKLFKKASVELLHIRNIDNNSCILIEGFCSDKYKSYKVKKFTCKSMKNKGNRSGIRIIYVYEIPTKTIHFLEIYYHEKDDTNYDEENLKKFLKDLEIKNDE